MSASISRSVSVESMPSSWRKFFRPDWVQVASSNICFCCSICAAALKRSCSRRRSTSSRRGSSESGFGGEGVAREEHAGLDVDEQRGDVDELAGGVDVGVLEVVGVLEELRGDAGDGDVVDVDVLLADEVEQEIEGAVVDLAYGDGEGGLRGFVFGFVAVGALGLRRWWSDRGVFQGEGGVGGGGVVVLRGDRTLLRGLFLLRCERFLSGRDCFLRS